jgi:hypothetical protein
LLARCLRFEKKKKKEENKQKKKKKKKKKLNKEQPVGKGRGKQWGYLKGTFCRKIRNFINRKFCHMAAEILRFTKNVQKNNKSNLIVLI